MNPAAAIVIFAVLWFLTLFVMLPIGLRTQGEAGEVVPGTHSSAPAKSRMGRKFFWVTVITLALWLPICAVMIWGGITVRDIDIWGRL